MNTTLKRVLLALGGVAVSYYAFDLERKKLENPDHEGE